MGAHRKRNQMLVSGIPYTVAPLKMNPPRPPHKQEFLEITSFFEEFTDCS